MFSMLAFRAGRSVPQLLTCGNVRSLVPSYEQVLDQSNGEAHDAVQSSKTFTDSNRCFQDQPTSALSRRLCHKIHVRIPRMRAGHLNNYSGTVMGRYCVMVTSRYHRVLLTVSDKWKVSYNEIFVATLLRFVVFNQATSLRF